MDSSEAELDIGAGNSFSARALYVGERIDVRTLAPRVAGVPVVLPVDGDRGWAVLFRYGVVVFFGQEREAQGQMLAELRPNITQPFPEPETEQLEVTILPDEPEGFDSDGKMILAAKTLGRLQLVAVVLAKSVVLAQYEASVASVFADTEPLAAKLSLSGRGLRRPHAVLKQIGGILMMQHKMVGRVEVTEKPELLWEKSGLERLYLILEEEYELRERHNALERKLEVISDTAETLLELLQAKRSLRVEWYIVILILVEIMITLYTVFYLGKH